MSANTITFHFFQLKHCKTGAASVVILYIQCVQHVSNFPLFINRNGEKFSLLNIPIMGIGSLSWSCPPLNIYHHLVCATNDNNRLNNQ